MSMRIHLDPTAEAGGGAPATPAPAPAAPAVPPPLGGPPAPAAPAPATPPTIPLTIDEFQRLRGLETRLAQIEAEKQREIEAKEQEKLAAMADKGKAQEALEQQRTSMEAKIKKAENDYATLRDHLHNKERTVVIGDAMAGTDFVSATAAKQVRDLLESAFETHTDSAGTITVRDRVTGRPAAEVIRERLASDEFAHFQKPKGHGGANAQNTTRRDPANPGNPGNLDPVQVAQREYLARVAAGGGAAPDRQFATEQATNPFDARPRTGLAGVYRNASG